MPTLTATPLPALGIIKIIADWTAAPDQLTDLIHVYRVTPDGTEVAVIGSPVYLSGGLAILYDTSPPLDVAITYRADMATANRAKDAFQRVVANGWGNADRGGTYGIASGAPSDFSTTGSQGMQVVNNGSGRVVTLAETYTDVQAASTVSLGTIPANSNIVVGHMLRYSSLSSHYRLGVQFSANGTMAAIIQRRTSSPATPVLLASQPLSGIYTANTQVRIESEAEGTQLRVRAWIGDSRPDDWSVTVADSTLTSGRVAFSSINNSTTNLNTFFDNTDVTSLVPQSVTSTPVTLATAPDGWIRDPYTPATSVRLDNCATHTFECLDADRFVFFQGFDEEGYDSNTGVFKVLDAERPVTVAQVRQDLTTTMRVVSTTLADIPALRALFRPGRDLVVSVPTEYGWGIDAYGTDWATVSDVTASRLNRRDMRKPQRLWSLPLAVTDPQDTLDAYGSGSTGSNRIPVPGATLGDMKATGLTYGQLKAAGRRYIDWAQGVFT